MGDGAFGEDKRRPKGRGRGLIVRSGEDVKGID